MIQDFMIYVPEKKLDIRIPAEQLLTSVYEQLAGSPDLSARDLGLLADIMWCADIPALLRVFGGRVVHMAEFGDPATDKTNLKYADMYAKELERTADTIAGLQIEEAKEAAAEEEEFDASHPRYISEKVSGTVVVQKGTNAKTHQR